MTPLLAATLAYAFGLLVGMRFDVPFVALAGVALLGLVACLQSDARDGWRVVGPWVFGVAGIVIGGMRADAARTDCRALLPDGTRIVMTGAPLALSVDGTTTAFDAHAIRAEAPSRGCGASTVRVRAAAPHLERLDSAALGHFAVEVRGRWLAYPRRSAWSRSPEYAGGVMIDAVRAAPPSHSAGASMRTRFGARQQQRLRALLPERWPLAEALLLAQTRGMSTETRDRWVDAGLVHMLAISGMHVGMIAAGVLVLGGVFGLPRRKAHRVALLVAASYVFFLGAPSAALRSLLQATLLLTALELQRPADPYTSLAASGLVIIVLEPLALIDAGFQLSFGGILGLMLWRRPILRMMPRRMPYLLRDGLASGIAASAITTPIAALHFGTASWIGIIGTPLAAPVMAAALLLLVVALLVAAVFGSVAGVHAWSADVTLWLLDRIAAWCAAVPGGHGNVAASTILACLAAGIAAILVRRAFRTERPAPASHASDAAHAAYAGRHVRSVVRIGVAVSAAIAVAAWAPRFIDRGNGQLRIHAIDVGQGDAFALRTPAGRWLLIDAGPRTATRDAGRDRVVPFLLRHGAKRIEALVLTHPHADHIGGTEAIMEVFDVGVILDPGLAFDQAMFTSLLDDALGDRQRWIAAREGVRFVVDGVEVTVLYPFRQLDVSGEPNDFSVVLRVRFGKFDALFFGDAPESVEAQIVAHYGRDLQSELLKVGHHGSRTSTGEVLLEAVRPGIALVPVGRKNVYRHPSPEVIERLHGRGVRILRTDELGDIVVSANRDGTYEAAARRR